MNRQQASALRRLKCTFVAFQRDVQSILAELENANNVASIELPEVKRAIEVVCDFYHVSHQQIMERNRVSHVAWARQVAIYLARKTSHYSDQSIAQAFLRERTNVIHAKQAVEERMEVDAKIRREVEQMLKQL